MKKSTHRHRRARPIDCLGLGIMPLDFLFEIPDYPPPGGKRDASALTIQGGGPVPNALVGLQRLGHTTALITAVADDVPGWLGVDEITREGVDNRFVVWKQGSSLMAGGFVEKGTGRRTIVLHRTLRVTPRDVVTSRLPVPRLIHLDGRDLEACIKLARWGRQKDVPICFDIGSMRNDVSPILPLVDHLVVADSFALPFTRASTARQAIERLRKRCSGTIVVTEGTRGSIGCEDGVVVTQPAYRVRNVDTTGAGDAYHTGYLYGLLHGYDLAARMHIGAVIAALKCTRPGARAGAPTWREIQAFLRKKPRIYA
ncbi:MAG: PfkB family carbohydrate kinase [Candidatus Zixiibacteriota bacterium]